MIGPFTAKLAQFRHALEKHMCSALGSNLELQCFPSPLQHYRARMEFSLHHLQQPARDKLAEQLRYAIFGCDKKAQYLESSTVPLVCISERMLLLLRYLESSAVLSHRLFQVNWRANLDGQVMLSLLYHRQLRTEPSGENLQDCVSCSAPLWCHAAEKLAQNLGLEIVLGRSKSQLVLGFGCEPYLDSLLHLKNGSELWLRQNDTCFFQPNPYTNIEMLDWARQHFTSPDSDLLELYCGIGNFTCALAPNFRRVLATEVVRQAIPLCHYNLDRNGRVNVALARLSAAETAQALAGERQFQRLASWDLPSYHLTHLLLDPPRSGLDEYSRHFAMNFTNILYISCNPETLLRDLAFWQAQGCAYRIRTGAAFDQFPGTKHLEIGLVLERH